ncbi:LysR family transcriptional regulator [Streptacidiphilus jiangxiensis]|uniref:DNA-binding transcriptional regulator, LysR family n=1 Tax=Streptacidiphilus jiangxiensis TaxID=235985 RepID=A0A1H7T056_STRJI|nr:LysR family transcriptional regulator [Streptacidiphilus jiangxiensis]SEL78241.1 DNA-binding transcriptional regulator, LysR family [Streptacidiphilus jiangxiensis]
MTLDDLRVFAAVCRAGSLSAAARELSCTQSAVSQHVKRLEREVGLSLVERHPRGVVPTPAGRMLSAAVTEGLGGIDHALRRIEGAARADGGSVRVTTGATTIRHFMSAAVVDFRRRFPRASLEFETATSSRGCFDALAAGRVDLAWITLGPTDRAVEQRPVVEVPWALAVSASSPLAAKDRVEPADLQDARLIGLPQNSTSRLQLGAWLGEAGIRPVFDTSVTDWDTAILLAELGLGLAVVPALPAWSGADHPDLRLIPIPALPALSVGWSVRSWDALSPLARAFTDAVTDHWRRQTAGARIE